MSLLLQLLDRIGRELVHRFDVFFSLNFILMIIMYYSAGWCSMNAAHLITIF